MRHVMVDIETLGTRPGSVIASVAAQATQVSMIFGARGLSL